MPNACSSWAEKFRFVCQTFRRPGTKQSITPLLLFPIPAPGMASDFITTESGEQGVRGERELTDSSITQESCGRDSGLSAIPMQEERSRKEKKASELSE